MYKIFYESKALILPNINEKILFSIAEGLTDKLNLSEKFTEIILGWLNNNGLDVVSEEIDDEYALFDSLKSVFSFAPAAGGVVCRDGTFVAILRNGIPDLPKGHIEKGESPSEAALREVEEETGISCKGDISPLPTTWHCYQLKGQWVLKQTFWFAMQPIDTLSLVPQKEEGITEVLTVGEDKIDCFIKETYRSIREILGLSLRNIITK